jgi:hypothetical protein
MLASKYVLHFMAVSTAYYYAFQGIPSTRWRLGKMKWVVFFAVLGVAFLLCNPAILLPSTWHEIRLFTAEKRIAHDAYEFMGTLYGNQVGLWFKGAPWYFYFVFMAVKLSLPVLIGFALGLPNIFKKKLGDGRILIWFWLYFWFVPFSVVGGKFTRYFVLVLPVVVIIAAIGITFATDWAVRVIARGAGSPLVVRIIVALVAVVITASASLTSAPHYRMYTNVLGGGSSHAGTFFPHDEFYDSAMREAAARVALIAPQGIHVASETPGLFSYYAERAGRSDLDSVSLSDRPAIDRLRSGDMILVEHGRRYFSNDSILSALRRNAAPVFGSKVAGVLSISAYVVDPKTLAAIRESVP